MLAHMWDKLIESWALEDAADLFEKVFPEFTVNRVSPSETFPTMFDEHGNKCDKLDWFKEGRKEGKISGSLVDPGNGGYWVHCFTTSSAYLEEGSYSLRSLLRKQMFDGDIEVMCDWIGEQEGVGGIHPLWNLNPSTGILEALGGMV